MRLLAWLAALHLLTLATCSRTRNFVEPFNCREFYESGPQAVPKLRGLSCYVCSCKDGLLTCEFGQCGEQESCHVKDSRWSGCKSCHLAQYGRVLSHGMSWPAPDDRCRVMHCSAGVVTQSRVICHPPCSREYWLWIRGECCPRCYGCNPSHVTNLPINDGESVRPFNDQGVLCKCESSLLRCFKEACPLPNCPKGMQSLSGRCLRCRQPQPAEEARVSPLQCFFEGRSYPNTTSWRPDRCTDCSCQHGTVLCQRRNCPVLECSQKDHFKQPADCCPECHSSQDCVDPSGRRYTNGAEWQADKCSRCVCQSGQISCKRPECPSVDACPPGSELQQESGDCCPRCVEKFGSCSTLGQPLLRTFDADIVRFKTKCKYTLARLCGGGRSKFKIRFVHSQRRRALQISMLRYRLSIGAGFKLRLNGHRTSISHVRSEGWLSVAVLSRYLQVRLRNGVSVVWDGRSFLEIQAPKALSGQLCGLCGNYNGNPSDDKIGTRGELLGSQQEFTRAWREGFCRADHKRPSNCLLRRKQRRWVRTYCSRLYSMPCAARVRMDPFYNWCVEEMCKCRRDAPQKCLCPVVRTVLRRCARQRQPISDLSAFPCAGRRLCPKTFVFSNCACPSHCGSRPGARSRCRRRCRRGCVCRGRRLLHNGKCVRPRRCPRSHWP